MIVLMAGFKKESREKLEISLPHRRELRTFLASGQRRRM
jgi:hypothetical protein